ncbi:leucine-rich repeat-containing G-protein coupled receptor 5-like [Chanos chanos]|uniref:Leucine-rich repeat-containing G-protein coupled receptor 5-like n=1 Tax=Chanos chanos TaxID=29144 RepID=A0A6J2WCF6_CHACN|nr:leucine-rich repeat-containing G-protein coupled receptor 5-like [Chanos chanos]
MEFQVPDCPSSCSCDRDGTFLRVDCANRGLTSLPANLSIFTSYLDLSMNNLMTLPDNAFSNLNFLEELRLAGNGLTHMSENGFSGLHNLKVLMLQNNRLTQVPGEALRRLKKLQSLSLDANHISVVPPDCFEGLSSLRHLWMDDNVLSDIPVQALGSLTSLQAVTFALNRISHIPDSAFANLSSLVVLHLHNNRIHSLGERCFEGLESLETLDLNYNNLVEFPVAIRDLTSLKELGLQSNNIKSIPENGFIGNPSLLTMSLCNNPVQYVEESAFQHLPKLQTLLFSGATELVEFPDLTGLWSLESLTITSASIASLPDTICDKLPLLQVLDLSYNLIQHLPSFQGCESMERIDLHHNEIREISAGTFQDLTALQSLDLAWNKIQSVHPLALSNLPSLIKLDLTSNGLSSLPVTGLSGLLHLRLGGNMDLQELLSSETFPKLRVVEMPHAYQCCPFLFCKKSSPTSITKAVINSSHSRKETNLRSIQGDHDSRDLFPQLEGDLSVQCFPTPGPFQTCDTLFGSWLIRTGVWTLVVLSLACNTLVVLTIITSPTCKTPAKYLISLLSSANAMTGLSSGVLALMDAISLGSFMEDSAFWRNNLCRVTAFLSVMSSEAAIFLLTASALEQGFSICFSKRSEMFWKPVSALCFLLAATVAFLPMSEYGTFSSSSSSSSLCLPLPFIQHSSQGFSVALVLINSGCYLVMTVGYVQTYCSQERGWLDDCMDCSLIKHIDRLLFTNCLLFIPVALLSLCSMLGLSWVSTEVMKVVVLLVVPLPSCLNPLLYILLNLHFKKDFNQVLRRFHSLKSCLSPCQASANSDDIEKQSCNSTQVLVTSVTMCKSKDTRVSQQTSACSRKAQTGIVSLQT